MGCALRLEAQKAWRSEEGGLCGPEIREYNKTYSCTDAAIAFANAWLGLRYFGERLSLERESHGTAVTASIVYLRSFDLDSRFSAREFSRCVGWIESIAFASIARVKMSFRFHGEEVGEGS